MKRVVWNAEEWDRLASVAAPMIAAGVDKLDAYRRAQDEVFRNNPGRKRPIVQTASIREGEPFLKMKLTANGIAGPQSSAIEVRGALPEVETDVPGWLEAQIEAEAERRAAALRAAFAERVAARVREKLAAPVVFGSATAPATTPADAPTGEESSAGAPTVPSAPPPAEAREERTTTALEQEVVRRKHDPSMPADDRAKLPTVVVFGLWPRFRDEISKEFAGALDLRFFDPDETRSRDLRSVEAIAASAQLFLIFHGIGGSFAVALGKKARAFETVNGGAKALADRLTKFVVYGK